MSQPRKRVLVFLLAQDRPLTHHEIRSAMPGKTLGAVTLYRVLKWLTENGLVQSLASADQSRRFSVCNSRQDHDHAHFQCTRCGTVTCLGAIPLPRHLPVPAGFRRQEVDLLIKGTCPACNGTP